MSMNRHEYFEELISASLSGDLSDVERQQLDAHMDTCAECPVILAAFADQRRIMGGLRHVAPPRDLHARVRTGVERGSFLDVPWWRRPVVIFGGLGGGLAAVAGVLLALVMLNGSPDEPQVGTGSTSPLPSASLVSSPPPSASAPAASATPGASEPVATPAQTPAASPSQPQVAGTPKPDVYLAYTGPFDNLVLTLRDRGSGETLAELTGSGPPLAAEMSPDGNWIAYITQRGESAMNTLHVTRLPLQLGADDPYLEGPSLGTPIAELATVDLGVSVAGSPFLEHMEWSFTGGHLAYTIADPTSGDTEAWIFDARAGEPRPVTDVGSGYAGSWQSGSTGPPHLWVSVAGEEPMSYLIPVSDEVTTLNPAEIAAGQQAGVFQPLLDRAADSVIFWRGVMARTEIDWSFAEGGAPYIAEYDTDGGLPPQFANERLLFSDVAIDRDAFTSAAITWADTSDAYAVWDVEWTGIDQGGEGGAYPDASRVYFSHASDPRDIQWVHAIDASDIPEGSFILDVKLPATNQLLITSGRPRAGTLDAPAADLLLVTRNTGTVADVVEVIGSSADGWFGPATRAGMTQP